MRKYSDIIECCYLFNSGPLEMCNADTISKATRIVSSDSLAILTLEVSIC